LEHVLYLEPLPVHNQGNAFHTTHSNHSKKQQKGLGIRERDVPSADSVGNVPSPEAGSVTFPREAMELIKLLSKGGV
jgi:hypothetical protein